MSLVFVIGPVHSVMIEGTIAGRSWSLACSSISLMIGAIFGVALRAELGGEIVPPVLTGSLQRRKGLLGGGGPGLSEKLRGYMDDAILGARCSSTGWLAKRLGVGWRISTSRLVLGSLTGNSSLGKASFGTGVPDCVTTSIGWLDRALVASKDRLAG